jgi:hypothetical protein
VSGICLIRVEAQRRGVLITLRMIPDADQVSSERVRKAADVEAAVQIVREFLREFVPMKTKQNE